MIDSSPTLTQNVEALQADGWTIAYGVADEGSFCDKTAKQIVIDPNYGPYTDIVTQTVAHETGHALYAAEDYIPPDGLTRAEYVARNTNRELKDEGEATMMNALVRDEILAAGGPDIGIAGEQAEKYAEIAKKYPDAADRDKARQEIADIFAKGEHPSTDKTKNYEDYYSKFYADTWDAEHPAP